MANSMDFGGDYSASEKQNILVDAHETVEPCLSLTERARELFDQLQFSITAEMRRRPATNVLLCEFATSSAELEYYNAYLAEHGATYLSNKGNMAARPETYLKAQAATRIATLASRLSVNPAGDSKTNARMVKREELARRNTQASKTAGSKATAVLAS